MSCASGLDAAATPADGTGQKRNTHEGERCRLGRDDWGDAGVDRIHDHLKIVHAPGFVVAALPASSECGESDDERVPTVGEGQRRLVPHVEGLVVECCVEAAGARPAKLY